MNAATQEALARFIAGKLGDDVDETGEYTDGIIICAPIPDNAEGDTDHWFYAASYLGSLNVAGRFWDWAVKWADGVTFESGQDSRLTAITGFPFEAFRDTPAALLALAAAVGFSEEGEVDVKLSRQALDNLASDADDYDHRAEFMSGKD